MRAYGEIDGIQYTKKEWCIRHMATKVVLSFHGQSKYVYVDNMRELRAEIADYKQELSDHEESTVQVRSLSDLS